MSKSLKDISPHTLDLFRDIFKILKPPPERTLSQWADEFRLLSRESSAEPGRWRTDRAPYQREMMDAITDIRVKKVVAMVSAQSGKTDALILNTVGYFAHYDPSPIMIVQPTIQMGEDFSKDRLAPMIRDTPVLAERIDDKSRISGNTIMHKVFPGGHVTIVGANSPSSLASRPIRILLADEIDRYPITAGKEGDPLLLAEKRTSTFWNKKEVCVSTPTIKDMSRIELEYEHSTQEVWNVPCPECGQLQPLSWEQIKFDKENLGTIYHECCHCGAVSDETSWKSQSINGKFIAEDPENPVRGFHLNALASNFTTWREIVEKFLIANEEKKKGNIDKLKAWTNTELAQTWEEDGKQLQSDELLERCEEYGCEVPEGVLYLTAGVDVQDDRLEVEVVGWGEEQESWGIQYAVIYGDPKLKNIWDDLDAFLSQSYRGLDGSLHRIACTCIDSGGHHASEVYAFCLAREHRRIFAIRGRSGTDKEFVPKATRNNRAKAKLFTLSVDVGKTLLYDRLLVEEPGPGYCHFPLEDDRGYTAAYFKGLTSEKQVLTYKKGRPEYVWTIKDSSYRRNEPLDCRNYAQAALEIGNPVLRRHGGIKQGSKRTRKTRSKGIGRT